MSTTVIHHADDGVTELWLQRLFGINGLAVRVGQHADSHFVLLSPNQVAKLRDTLTAWLVDGNEDNPSIREV
jgi:uncharacterized protein HemX